MNVESASKVPPARGRAACGFTLLELLITVVLLGILAAIAIPSYSAYITRGQRAAAKAALMQSAQGLERYYTVNGSYTAGASAVIPFAPNDGGQITYALAPTLASQTYSLTATPCGTAGTCPSASTFNDAECGALTLTNTGLKTVSGGTNTDPAYCWGH
ncbi:MAG TPA: type IV pilin protein [Burkholderiaceae bacterium]|jgi:type IV pilus assembly protein PilE|nr:type IV pilin protein [Burkholderiaceae bacterium]